jgi:hypothetical protein
MPPITAPSAGHRALIKISQDPTVSQRERAIAIKALGNLEFMRLKIKYEAMKQRRPPKADKPYFGL